MLIMCDDKFSDSTGCPNSTCVARVVACMTPSSTVGCICAPCRVFVMMHWYSVHTCENSTFIVGIVSCNATSLNVVIFLQKCYILWQTYSVGISHPVKASSLARWLQI
jgi:hypothetical protein